MSRIEALRQQLHTSIDACMDEHVLEAANQLMGKRFEEFEKLPEAVKVGLAKSSAQAKIGELKSLEQYQQERKARRENA